MEKLFAVAALTLLIGAPASAELPFCHPTNAPGAPPDSFPNIAKEYTDKTPNEIRVLADQVGYRPLCTFSDPATLQTITLDFEMKRFLGYQVASLPVTTLTPADGNQWPTFMTTYTDQNGYLPGSLWTAMRQSGQISHKARLTIIACDVDENSPITDPVNCDDPEVDKVFLNGVYLGNLEGVTDQWSTTEFYFDTNLLRFPITPGGTANNQVIVQVDVDNYPEPCWCTQIRYAMIEFDVAEPLCFVHGITIHQTASSYHDLTDSLIADGYSFFMPQLEPCGGRYANASILKTALSHLYDTFGTHFYHVLAHSKGGLDYRTYHDRHTKPDSKPKALAVCTTASPHRGTPLADATALREYLKFNIISDYDLILLKEADYALRDLARWGCTLGIPDDQGLHALTIHSTHRYNQRGLTAHPDQTFMCVAGHADGRPRDVTINAAEADPYVTLLAKLWFKILSRVGGVTQAPASSFPSLNVYTGAAIQNDLLVQAHSAILPPFRPVSAVRQGTNHAHMTDRVSVEPLLHGIRTHYGLKVYEPNN